MYSNTNIIFSDPSLLPIPHGIMCSIWESRNINLIPICPPIVKFIPAFNADRASWTPLSSLRLVGCQISQTLYMY